MVQEEREIAKYLYTMTDDRWWRNGHTFLSPSLIELEFFLDKGQPRKEFKEMQ